MRRGKYRIMASCEKLPEVLFPFPFQPYDIQQDFMKALYRCIEDGKVGIFESPTGTGKSLSLICGALKWLEDYEKRKKEELENLLSGKTCAEEINRNTITRHENKGSEPDWIQDYEVQKEQHEMVAELKEKREKLLKREAKLQQLRRDHKFRVKRKRDCDKESDFSTTPEPDRLTDADTLGEGGDDSDLIVADYNSDEEDRLKAGDNQRESDSSTDNEEEAPHVTKVYYCSRTHSQLSQFVQEVIKSPYGNTATVVTLGSRQNLCVNEAVKKLKSLSLMNDKCLELQKNKKGEVSKSKKRKKTGAAGGCPYYEYRHLQQYKDRALVEVKDIEQLVGLGKKLHACPYYGTRFAIPSAQLVVLPYNTLLHRSTREACGIKLAGNIVIIDEAHNLLETISSIHSVLITGDQLAKTHSQLGQYMEKYKSRLKAKNLMYIKQILSIMGHFIKYLGGQSSGAASQKSSVAAETKLLSINNFLFEMQIDNINIFKIYRYCEKSQISKKLNGFVSRYHPPLAAAGSEQPPPATQSGLTRFLQSINQEAAAGHAHSTPEQLLPDDESERHSFTSPLRHIKEFLLALTNTNQDGRIVVNRQGGLSGSSLKFLLLNPAIHFKEVITESRAVIIAGGTMQPTSELKHQLLASPGLTTERVTEFTCGHVIPSDQLLPIALCRGPTGLELDFTYQSRDSSNMMDELGRVLFNIGNVVAGGVVVFFPSYDYERQVHTHWERTGALQRLASKKRVFREPKKTSQLERVLADYSKCIRNALKPDSTTSYNGALLLSVVGGKMSEGINFSDDMGRCVVMVGMPYPNIKSPELKEKMDYLNSTMPKSTDGRLPGQIHYENLCMKAVNQSIGRSIRHKGDYATILLADTRYSRASMRDKLPGWMATRLQVMPKFGPYFAAVRRFFLDRKSVKSPSNILN